MQAPLKPSTLLHGIDDQAILYPCFRFVEVKKATTHIALKLDFEACASAYSASILSHKRRETHLSFMATPARFTEDQLCYAMRFIYSDTAPSLNVDETEELAAAIVSPWFLHPLDLYLHLIQTNETSGKLPGRTYPHAIAEPKRPALPSASSLHLSGLNLDLFTVLDECGFEKPLYSEITSLSFWRVSPSFIRKLASAGYAHFTMNDIVSIWQSKVPVSYLKAFKDAGYNHFKAEEYEAMYRKNIDPRGLFNARSGT